MEHIQGVRYLWHDWFCICFQPAYRIMGQIEGDGYALDFFI